MTDWHIQTYFCCLHLVSELKYIVFFNLPSMERICWCGNRIKPHISYSFLTNLKNTWSMKIELCTNVKNTTKSFSWFVFNILRKMAIATMMFSNLMVNLKIAVTLHPSLIHTIYICINTLINRRDIYIYIYIYWN